MKDSITGLLTAVFVASAIPGAHAATISVDMIPGGLVDSARIQAPGDSLSVDVLIGPVPDLAGFQFELLFDPSILSASLIVSGGLFGGDTFLIDDTILPGSISFAETTLAPAGVNVGARAVLASIQFNVLTEGTTILDLRNPVLADSLAEPIDVGAVVDGELIARSPLQTVPEPATVWLLVLGGGSWILRRKR
jgi:hypothetical protein